MEIVIKIPKEFENHFNSDRFEDSLQRVRFDIHKAIIAKKDILSWKYEIETLDMLTEAFLNGTPLPKGHGILIDADEFLKENKDYTSWVLYSDAWGGENDYNNTLEDLINDAPTIIEADKAESEED